MRVFLKLGLITFLFVSIWSCTSPNDIIDYTEDLSVVTPEPGSTPGYNEDKNLYFGDLHVHTNCLLYTSPSPRDRQKSRMPSSA